RRRCRGRARREGAQWPRTRARGGSERLLPNPGVHLRRPPLLSARRAVLAPRAEEPGETHVLHRALQPADLRLESSEARLDPRLLVLHDLHAVRGARVRRARDLARVDLARAQEEAERVVEEPVALEDEPEVEEEDVVVLRSAGGLLVLAARRGPVRALERGA